MLVRVPALFDSERDADLLAALEGAESRAAVIRELMRAGLRARQAGAGSDLAAIEQVLRRVLREELGGLRVQAPPGPAGPEADEATRAKVRALFKGMEGAG